jgi:DNA-binding SARP family transcriptional activator/tetratricopeptide (TPR) repeat protein
MLEVRLLGQFETCLNGAKVKILSRAEQSLLAYLILNAGTPFRREHLAGLIWPESGESDARGYLRQALWRLRKALAAGQSEVYDYFLGDKISLAFNTRLPYWVDAAVLEDGDRDGLEDLLAAAQVYHGEFLPGFYEDWVVLERERLRGQFERLMQGLLERLQSERRWEELQQQAERWIALGDTPELAYRSLILAHAARGDKSSAMAAYRRCQQALERELGVPPSPETNRLAEQVRAGKPVVEVAQAIVYEDVSQLGFFQNLPSHPGPFIGRETELAEIAELLANPDCRLLTLVGPGGIGKSRLALRAGENLTTSYPQGVCYVPLAGVGSSEFIPSGLLTALGLDLLSKSDPKQQLFNYLKDRKMLLVLDNFEHLIAGTGLLSELLHQAPRVKLLVTSRERLSLQREWVYAVKGLPYPRTSGEPGIEPYASMTLFAQTAQRARANFTLNEYSRPFVARICSLVEGMPLAIELAAAWIPVLEPQGIANEVEHSLDILEGDFQDLPERQRSMRAVFNSSWEMLHEQEQDSVEKLSIFRGGFTLEAAQEAFGISVKNILTLVNKCWVQPDSGGRFHVHELIRQYAGEQLQADHMLWEHTNEAHSAYYCWFLKKRESEWYGPRLMEIFSEIKTEIQNIEAGWRWAVNQGRTNLIGQALESLCKFYDNTGRRTDGESASWAAADHLKGMNENQALLLRSKALAWQGYFRHDYQIATPLFDEANAILEWLEQRGCDIRPEKASLLFAIGHNLANLDIQQAQMLLSQSATLYEALGDEARRAEAINLWGFCEWMLGKFDQAQHLAKQSMAIYKQEHNGPSCPMDLQARILRERGQLEEAEHSHRQCIASAQKLGLLYDEMTIRQNLAQTLLCAGKFSEAQANAQECLHFLDRNPDHNVTYGLTLLAWAWLHQGDYEQASVWAGRSLENARKVDDPLIGVSLISMGEVELAENRLAEALERLQKALAETRAREQFLITGMALEDLAYTARALNQPDQARLYLFQCLEEAASMGSFRIAIHALPAVALLETDQGRIERAVELYALACKYPYISNSKWFEDIAGKHIESASASLPAETFAAAKTSGRLLDFWETIKQWLGENSVSQSKEPWT